MAKIKLTFTDEHIALIKALNFSQIDVNEIIKSFEQYNKEVLIINDPDKFYENVKDVQTKIINKDTSPSMLNPIKSGVEEISIGEILYRNHIDIDNIYGIDLVPNKYGFDPKLTNESAVYRNGKIYFVC
jgi:hypothetical protein